jgi:hypothetical protein
LRIAASGSVEFTGNSMGKCCSSLLDQPHTIRDIINRGLMSSIIVCAQPLLCSHRSLDRSKIFSQQRRRVTGIYTTRNLQKIMLTQYTPVEKRNQQNVARIQESANIFG